MGVTPARAIADEIYILMEKLLSNYTYELLKGENLDTLAYLEGSVGSRKEALKLIEALGVENYLESYLNDFSKQRKIFLKCLEKTLADRANIEGNKDFYNSGTGSSFCYSINLIKEDVKMYLEMQGIKPKY